MTHRQIIYKSSTSPVKYLIPATFVLLATAAYLFALHFFIIGILAFFAVSTALNDTLTIKVYNDGFEFVYNNVFGQLFEIKHSFLYADIKNYDCEITQWKANFKQAFFIVLVEYMLPGRSRTKLRKDPEAHIIIDTKNPLNEIDQYETTLVLDEWSHKKALELITKKLKKY